VPDAVGGFIRGDPVKVQVMSYAGRLVADGCAEWTVLEDGGIELCLDTGETFLLAGKTITRLA
jgi:hypothetical protein